MSEGQDNFQQTTEGAPRWMGIAVVALAVLSMVGVGMAWNATNHAHSAEEALATQSKMIQQNQDGMTQRVGQTEQTTAQSLYIIGAGLGRERGIHIVQLLGVVCTALLHLRAGRCQLIRAELLSLIVIDEHGRGQDGERAQGDEVPEPTQVFLGHGAHLGLAASSYSPGVGRGDRSAVGFPGQGRGYMTRPIRVDSRTSPATPPWR